MGSLPELGDFSVCGNGIRVLSCDGTVAGPVTSEEPLCVQKAERAQSSSAFSSLPLGRKKYFISCGGKFWMVYQNFAAAYRFSDIFLPCVSEHRRAELSTLQSSLQC